MNLFSLDLAPPISLVAAAAIGVAGVAAEVCATRLLKQRRFLSYPASEFADALLVLIFWGGSALSLIALPYVQPELFSVVIAWGVGALLCRATLDRIRWLGRE